MSDANTAADASLSQLDLALCVDLTNSMTPFISAAREQLSSILDRLVAVGQLDLRAAIVGYRDYGQGVELTEVHAFSQDVSEVRQVLDGLVVKSPRDNTDAAEAVFAGLLAAIDELSWRPRATKILVLVGDAPPHGCETRFGPFPDRYEEDPTGKSLLEVGAHIEGAGVTLYSLGMVPSVTQPYDRVLEQSFERLARTTGGAYHNARDGASAMAVVEAISERVSQQIGFDRHVYFALAELRRDGGQPDGAASLRSLAADAIETLTEKLDASDEQIYEAVARLQKRGL